MAMPAYMTIVGQTQGNITAQAATSDSVGLANLAESQDHMLVLAMDHVMTVPTDIVSGQITGRRIHGPLRITKRWDRTSPQLMEALNAGEPLTEVKISWYRPGASNDQQLFYTTTLEGCRIVKIRSFMHNCLDPNGVHLTHLEEVDFSYDKITVHHELCGTRGIEDLRAPSTK